MKRFEKMKKLPLRHDLIIFAVAGSITRCALRYLLMTGYLLACRELGLYDYGWIVKVVVTITSICLSRLIFREFGKIIYSDMDEPIFNDVGIIAMVRECKQMIDRWN